MKAIVQRSYGAPEVLTVEDRPTPAPGPRELLVRVHASTLTQGDRRIRAADYPGALAVLGRLVSGVLRPRHEVPGTTWAGEVVAVGAEVASVSVGERRFGLVMGGAHAEYLVVPEDGAHAVIPDALSFAEASALPYGAATARHFLVDLGQLGAGESVAVVGASGGVGRFAVQLAHQLGAEVTAVARRDEASLRALGARDVWDPSGGPMLPDGRSFDVVLDTTDKLSFAAARRSLTSGGRYLTLGLSVGILVWMLLHRVLGGSKPIFAIAPDSPEGLARVAEQWNGIRMRPVLDRSFDFNAFREAHAHLEVGRPGGAVVLRVAPERSEGEGAGSSEAALG